MDTKADLTKKLIIECAREEFLTEGFHNASLRKIASAAQVTTGAIYRHFKDKKALFFAATEDAVEMLREKFTYMADTSIIEAGQGVSYSQDKSISYIADIYNLIYEYFDQFYLLLMCQDAKDADSFFHEFVEVEEKTTIAYMEKLKEHYNSSYEIDTVALHFLIEAYVSALFEPIRHRMSREKAIFHAQNLCLYFATGWLGLEEKLRS